jgi:hypothetical protein
MSLSFINTPEDFQPVLEDGLYFTVSSTTYNSTSQFNFRYVFDLYVENDLVYRGKAAPNPYGLGIIGLSEVLETYTNSLPVSYWNTTPIYTHQTFPFSRPANDEVIYYELKVGYEYADSEVSSITGFTGVGNNQGEPAFASGGYKTFRSTLGTNGRATQADFNIGPFVLSGTPLSTNPTTSGLFLTNQPRIQDVSIDDYGVLAFTNYYLFSGLTTGLSEPYYVEYKFYDDQGALITGTTHDNITTNGGGPRSNCNDVYPALYLIEPISGTDYNTLYVASGPANIPYIPANAAQYTVQLYGVFEGATTPLPPTPTPTPNPTSTPLPITPTPTPSTTPPCSGCTEFTVEYTGESSSTVITIQNCLTGLNQNLTIQKTVIYVVCSCIIPFTSGDVDIVALGPCSPNPTPTNTPSPTRTPTPTGSCGFKAWNILECASPCSGGICSCEGGTTITVYTDCTVTDITDPFTEIYNTSALTSPFTGDFRDGGSIYNSSGSNVTLVCNIGGPC